MTRAGWLKARLRAWRSDERGFVLVFFAVALPALLGLVGLAIDVGRLLTLDTQLADIADAAALAAASRLDRSEGAIGNARESGNALINTASFASGGGRVSLQYRFAANLSDLRRSPTYSLSEETGASAHYVEVTTADRSIEASFLQFIGARPVPIRRRAIAESQYLACDVTPAIMCQRDPEDFIARARKGRQYRLTFDGGTDDGTIALFEQTGERSGRSALRNLASNAPEVCYTDSLALRRNLSAQDFDDAVNVRFDRYANGNGPIAQDLAVYPPAPNVIQGRRLNSCNSPPEGGDINPPYHLPRDSAFKVVNRSTQYDAGIGDWPATTAYGASGSETAATALGEYVYWNHSDKPVTFQGELLTVPTRYELYLKELGLTPETEATPVPTGGFSAANRTMPTGGPKAGPYSPLAEHAVAQCYRGNLPAVEARRRIVYLGIADCRDFGSHATALGLSGRIGKFFLTEPSSSGAVFVEFVNMIRPVQDDGKLRHIVQLVDID